MPRKPKIEEVEIVPEAPAKTNHTKLKAQAAETAIVAEANTASKDVAKREDHAYYVSAKEELTSYDMKIAGTDYRPSWDKSRKRLVWRIPKGLAHRFEAHSHFLSGRIIRSTEG